MRYEKEEAGGCDTREERWGKIVNVNFGIITFFGLKFPRSSFVVTIFAWQREKEIGDETSERNHDKVIKQLKVEAAA